MKSIDFSSKKEIARIQWAIGKLCLSLAESFTLAASWSFDKAKAREAKRRELIKVIK
jgi:hypothetical protein